mgnify:CR=1 FL=1
MVECFREAERNAVEGKLTDDMQPMQAAAVREASRYSAIDIRTLTCLSTRLLTMALQHRRTTSTAAIRSSSAPTTARTGQLLEASLNAQLLMRKPAPQAAACKGAR